MNATHLRTLILLTLLSAPAALAAPRDDSELEREWLVIDRVGSYGRLPVYRDALLHKIVQGEFLAPRAGDEITLPNGTVRSWRTAHPNEDGWLQENELRGGYACLHLKADATEPWILHARGHSTVYVNGAPRAGDPYNGGWLRIPILLRKGDNYLLFRVGRGRLRADLTKPPNRAFLLRDDVLLPDLLSNERGALQASIPVVNAAQSPLHSLTLTARQGNSTLRTDVGFIAPMTFRKVPFTIPGEIGSDPASERELIVSLSDASGAVISEEKFSLRVRRPDQKHRRTFLSRIDGSAQYYAVVPPSNYDELYDDRGQPLAGGAQPGLVLTLHGASVEATSQANAYAPKRDLVIIAPTNRRPFGFDWEDWGRIDALEVFAHAMLRYQCDPDRVYLTGHSMGGHGVWHIGTTFPDLFAAIGPSAGWPDFWSYGGGAQFDESATNGERLNRAANPSRTIPRLTNLARLAVYILHGERDDNVPARLGRNMAQALAEFHSDFAYFEQPGAGHWWGNQCVDWPRMFAFFRDRTRTPAARSNEIDFITHDPAISNRCAWARITQQHRTRAASRIQLKLDREARTLSGTTENVAQLVLDLAGDAPDPLADPFRGFAPFPPDLTALPRYAGLEVGASLAITLDDGDTLNIPITTLPSYVTLQRDNNGHWTPTAQVPHDPRLRPQAFKQAFRNRFILVYGTGGSKEFLRATYEKARYDAESFAYRGNAAPLLISDAAFVAARSAAPPNFDDVPADRNPYENWSQRSSGFHGHNVILYGTRATNQAFAELLPNPASVPRPILPESASGYGYLIADVSPANPTTIVGIVSGTTPAGMRTTFGFNYFVSGVHYPLVFAAPDNAFANGLDDAPTAWFAEDLDQ